MFAGDNPGFALHHLPSVIDESLDLKKSWEKITSYVERVFAGDNPGFALHHLPSVIDESIDLKKSWEINNFLWEKGVCWR